jgi:protein-S-isoprenylcysteine O-methyltransferase Ste14
MARFSLQRTRLSDWVGFLCFAAFAGVSLTKAPAVGMLLLPTIAYESFMAIGFLIRDPVRGAVRSARARLAAYAGTFLLLAFFPLANRVAPTWLTPTGDQTLRTIGALLWLGGAILVAFSAWHLRHAFSVEPEARRLITSGPYRVARHPVYTGYLLQNVGTWFLFPTLPFAIVLVCWLTFTVDRMRNEERILGNVFPEYAEYQRRVGRLGPMFFPRDSRTNETRVVRPRLTGASTRPAAPPAS